MAGPFSKRSISISIAVVLTATANYFLKYFFAYVIFGTEHYNALSKWQKTMLVQGSGLLLCFLVAGMLSAFSFSRFKEMMGLHKSALKPFVFALLANLPSFVGYALVNGYNEDTSYKLIGWNSLWPGFAEELVYRAFIVGVLVRYAHWNFIVAAILSGFLFAAGHLYQADSFSNGVQIFLFTSGVGIGFSVFYKYWDWNIWFPIFMHTFMNLAYVLFVGGGTALMNGTENIFRFTTIGIAIILTVYQKMRSSRKLEE